VQRLIEDNPQESRKKWMLWMMERAGSKKSNIKGKQFWQQHNKPIELWSPEVIIKKVDYLLRRQDVYPSKSCSSRFCYRAVLLEM
jgi:putative transposase